MTRRTSRIAAGFVAAAAAGAFADGDVQVALKPADMVDGRRVSAVGVPVVNAAGAIACEVTNSSPSGHQFVVIGTGATTVVARSGDAAPGTNAAVFDSFPADTGTGDGHLVLTDDGSVLFGGALAAGVGDASQAAGNLDGIWVGGTQALTLVARDNTPLPGVAANYELELSDFAYSDADTVVVSVRPTSGNARFLLAGPPGALVSKGNAPNIDAPFVNASGYAIWQGNTGFFPNAVDFVRELAGDIVTNLWVGGDPFPEVAGATFLETTAFGVNSAGKYFGRAQWTPSGLGESAILTGTGTTRALLFKTGDAMPGTSETFRSARTGAIADNGVVAWIGPAANGRDALFIHDGSSVRAFANQDTQAPGLPAGVKFATNYPIPSCMNGKGEVALVTRLSGPDVTSFNGRHQALWVAKPDGSFTLVMRGGEEMSQTPQGDDAPLVNLVTAGDENVMYGPHNGQGRWFNDDGTIVLQAELGFSTALVVARAGAGTAGPGFGLAKGDVTDSAKPGKDKVVLSGTFPKLGKAFDPRPAAGSFSFGDPVAPVVLAIAASDPRWKGKKGNFTLKTAKGSTPAIVLSVNAAKGTFTATITKFDLAVAPATAFLASLEAGGARGSDIAAFQDRGGGKFRFRE